MIKVLKWFQFGLLMLAVVFITSAASAESYQFERTWPPIRQPWHFLSLYGIASDPSGYVYIADTYNHRIQKFTRDGFFVLRWGKLGTGNGEFNRPVGIAADGHGHIYVTDYDNHRIQQFTESGDYLNQWGIQGSEDGQFKGPSGIAVDQNDQIYVADSQNARIQNFDSSGKFLAKWGYLGTEQGQFKNPGGLAVFNGFIYAADTDNHRIQKFTLDGTVQAVWGTNGQEPGQFNYPIGLSIDQDGNVYVGDKLNRRIQKFDTNGNLTAVWDGNDLGFQEPLGLAVVQQPKQTPSLYITDAGPAYIGAGYMSSVIRMDLNGKFIEKWGVGTDHPGDFQRPGCLAFDRAGYLYAADFYNHRIQKFSSDGEYLSQWGSYGSGDGQLSKPVGAAIAAVGDDDYIFVTDSDNHRIQKFKLDGTFVKAWGSKGNGDGQFDTPTGIAADNEFIYVTDSANHRVQKFNFNGDFAGKWGSMSIPELDWIFPGFLYPTGVIVNQGAVFIADTGNHRIWKCGTNGQFHTNWRGFNYPSGLASDNEGNIYVSDSYNHRIRKLNLNGGVICEFGEFGSLPGQFSYPIGMTVSGDGKVYVSDTGNNRIQVFRKGLPDDKIMKAVIVAGSRDKNEQFRNAVLVNTNMAFRALVNQGFTKSAIRYLVGDSSEITDSDEPIEPGTLENLEHAVTVWADDADMLVIYLADHGDDGVFSLNSKPSNLNLEQLNNWMDTLKVPQIILIYDACKSGTFIPSDSNSENRIIITSSSADENAEYINQGLGAFSSFFWTHIFNGMTVGDAFRLSKQVMLNQTPQLYDPQNQAGTTRIGNGKMVSNPAPVVGSISVDQTDTSISVSAFNVTDTDGISRVWAKIWKMDSNPQKLSTPLIKAPSFDLMKTEIQDHFTGTLVHGEALFGGIYQIAVYAKDGFGSISVPKLITLNKTGTVKRKAVIVAGYSQNADVQTDLISNAAMAYRVLKFKWYSDEDIYIMSPDAIPGAISPVLIPTKQNFKNALEQWAGTNLYDLVIYMTGTGNSESFQLNPEERVVVSDLGAWLNNLETSVQTPMKTVIIYEAAYAKDFLKSLAESHSPADNQRILISGTQTSAIHDTDISFSAFFWKSISLGYSLRDAVRNAYMGVKEQLPEIDADGNGVFNEESDLKIALGYGLGADIILAQAVPILQSISSDQLLKGHQANLWVTVDSLAAIEKVWGIVTPAGSLYRASINFSYNSDSNRFEAAYTGWSSSDKIAVYAKDSNSMVSIPLTTTITRCRNVRWDFNLSGTVDLADAVIAIQTIGGFIPQKGIPVLCEEKTISEITMADLIAILKILTGCPLSDWSRKESISSSANIKNER